MKQLFLIEELPEGIENKYLAVLLASQRAKELGDGAMPMVKQVGHKNTTIAIKEMFSGMFQNQRVSEKSVAGNHGTPDKPLSDVDEVFEDVPEEEVEEEIVFEAEYVDDSGYQYDDEEEAEEGI